MAKTCPVDGCDIRIASSWQMCHDHWFSIPFDARHRVHHFSNKGTTGSEKEYQIALSEAVAEANQIERRDKGKGRDTKGPY